MSRYEENVIKYPLSRKILKDRTIYATRLFPTGDGLPVLCDFGEARFGDQHNCGMIMPDFHRAPEVILGFPGWDYQVDSWGVGMLVSLPHYAFRLRSADSVDHESQEGRSLG
ncbi:hypothetical protein BO86DRAFT_385027 [Aspergillus japonicus CBS 114.51]|uniref:Protein kinase domain-containing protein n=1 Tax=Aspergillus japonicus CBS 114.51 TaxID=1448312 RepID=A0A8T8XI10_ASPJA|nr:hypothetical protein BO86DRAFT_385027 [Aspergillus japonicus CBS 114.51]RAH87032.1 hypothetical protein BO86DRAFT_385027 [Aspergillus japonicus CBS 114.51]